MLHSSFELRDTNIKEWPFRVLPLLSVTVSILAFRRGWKA